MFPKLGPAGQGLQVNWYSFTRNRPSAVYKKCQALPSYGIASILSYPDNTEIGVIICHLRGSDYPIIHGFTKDHYIQCPITDQARHYHLLATWNNGPNNKITFHDFCWIKQPNTSTCPLYLYTFFTRMGSIICASKTTLQGMRNIKWYLDKTKNTKTGSHTHIFAIYSSPI